MIRFSKSKLNTYITCPEKYYCHYELRMRALKTSKTLVEGSAIHRLVEEGLMVGDTIPGHLEEISRLFWEDHPFEQCAYETLNEYLVAQRLCLWQSRQFLGLLEGVNAIRTELEMHTELIHPITGEFRDDIGLLGYLDLVLLREDGTSILADLKTVGRTPREGMSKIALEMTLYAYQYFQPIENMGFIQYPVALIYLIRKRDPSVLWDESTRSLPHFVELFDICVKIAENIEQRVFWKSPSLACGFCDSRSLCYRDEEAAITTFGEEQWHRYLLDLHRREQDLINLASVVNF